MSPAPGEPCLSAKSADEKRETFRFVARWNGNNRAPIAVAPERRYSVVQKIGPEIEFTPAVTP